MDMQHHPLDLLKMMEIIQIIGNKVDKAHKDKE